jgi:hypothetical protein
VRIEMFDNPDEIVEIELVCANSEFFGRKKALDIYKKYFEFQRKYPEDDIRITDAPVEPHEGEFYYQCSVFCKAQEVSAWVHRILECGLHPDVLHTRNRLARIQWECSL